MIYFSARHKNILNNWNRVIDPVFLAVPSGIDSSQLILHRSEQPCFYARLTMIIDSRLVPRTLTNAL